MVENEDPKIKYVQENLGEDKGDFTISSLPNYYKQRKLTEDLQEWNLSENLDSQFSKQSDIGRLRKIHSYGFVKDQKDSLDIDDLEESPKSLCLKKTLCSEVIKNLNQDNTILSRKLSKISSFGDSFVTSLDETISVEKLLMTARSLCGVLNGKLLSTEILSGRGGNSGLNFECCNKHQFIISLSTLSKLKAVSSVDRSCKDSWCLKCRNFLLKTIERAKSLNSSVLSACLHRGCVEIKCENQHKFEVKYTKNHYKNW